MPVTSTLSVMLLNMILFGWVVPEAVDVLALTYLETKPSLALGAPEVPEAFKTNDVAHTVARVQASVASFRKSRDFFVSTLASRLTGVAESLPVVTTARRFVMRSIRKANWVVWGFVSLIAVVLSVLLIALIVSLTNQMRHRDRKQR
jgi:uncharacterized membrane protein YcjF (UPF0283 family)